MTLYRIIKPGRVLVDCGPITMSILAKKDGQPYTKAALSGAEKALSLLQELIPYLHFARQSVVLLPKHLDSVTPDVLHRMIHAVACLGEYDFTPMAAVAGSFSDIVKEAVITAGADHVVVNNGGDIAFKLSNGAGQLRVGIMSDLATRKVTHVLVLPSTLHEGGVATSGLGGRALTKGIASAVVVVAMNGSLADAAATAIANATNCKNDRVIKCVAEDLDNTTDIRGHVVTKIVGDLGTDSIDTALAAGIRRAKELYCSEIIKGAVIFVKGKSRKWPVGLQLCSLV